MKCNFDFIKKGREIMDNEVMFLWLSLVFKVVVFCLVVYVFIEFDFSAIKLPL